MWYSRRSFGDVPDPAYVMSHHPGVLKATLSYEGKVAKWDALDADLKNLAQLASAASIGCSWCMDFGYFAAHSKGQSVEKFAEVPRWRESDVFTPLERDVIAYAEAMTATPPEVTDEMVDGLVAEPRGAGRRGADEDGGRGERAFAVQQRAGADQPGLLRPLRAGATAMTDPFAEHRDLAVHRGLRDARLRGRRRGRGAGGVAPLAGGGPRDGRQPARLRGADRDPAGAQPDAHAQPASRGVRRTVAARAAAHRAGRRRRRGAVRVGVDGDARGDGVALADRARRVRAARGVRLRARRDRRGRRQEPRRRTPDRAPRPRARRRPGARSRRRPGPSTPRSPGGSPRQRRPATSRPCSACSRPTWCW